MVNSQYFANRLEKVMSHYNLSASSFSEKIGVGRSSISHILSGRNKPSLDFILKILGEFPEVNLYWLMNGKGDFFRSNDSISPSYPPSLSTKVQNQKSFEKKEFSEKQKPKSDSTSSTKTIDKVIIFYMDGSFESFDNKD